MGIWCTKSTFEDHLILIAIVILALRMYSCRSFLPSLPFVGRSRRSRQNVVEASRLCFCAPPFPAQKTTLWYPRAGRLAQNEAVVSGKHGLGEDASKTGELQLQDARSIACCCCTNNYGAKNTEICGYSRVNREK
jgi:hypothetical protein